jgi:WD40 repeat protein
MFGVNRDPASIAAQLEECWYVALADHVIDLQWSPDGRQLLAATVEGLVVVIDDLGQRAQFRSVGQHKFGANAVAWSRDGQMAASGGQDGCVCLWSGGFESEPVTLRSQASWVSRVAFSPRRDVLAWSAGKSLQLWNATNGAVFYQSAEHFSTIADLAWNPDGSAVAVVAYNGVTLHVPGKSTAPRKYTWKGSSLTLAWSPDAKYVATGDQDSTIHFWHMKSGKDARMSGFPTKVLELTWHHSSRWLVTGGGSAIVLWDCSGAGPAGRRPHLWESGLGKIRQVAFQPRGDYLASTDHEGILLLWHLADRQEPIAACKLSAAGTCLRWSPDGQRLAIGQANGLVVVFELQLEKAAP